MTGGSRDTKGCRFGVKLERTQFRTPEYLARFTLLVGVALLLLPCKPKGPRLSLLRVGIWPAESG
jgi:hypothetical protein